MYDLLAAALLTSMSAAAEPAAAAPQGSTIVVTGDRRLFCRSSARTGSRFRTRHCMTMAERERLIVEFQRVGGDLINARLYCVNPGC